MRTIVLGLIAALMLAGVRAEAAPVIVNFSFDNPGAGGGTVSGIVLGLVDDMAGQQATSVRVTSNTAGFGIGEYVGVPIFNSWTVTGGQVTEVQFLSFGSKNKAPAVTSASLAFTGLTTVQPGLTNDSDVVFYNGFGDIFTVAPVPLPATLPLVLAALGGLGLAARRRRVA